VTLVSEEYFHLAVVLFIKIQIQDKYVAMESSREVLFFFSFWKERR